MKELHHMPTDNPAEPCCVNLRCKSMYYRADERPGFLHQEEAMGYWCSQTDDPIGPDNSLAAHTRCQAGRECFAATLPRRSTTPKV